jgi:hypothetical protein
VGIKGEGGVKSFVSSGSPSHTLLLLPPPPSHHTSLTQQDERCASMGRGNELTFRVGHHDAPATHCKHTSWIASLQPPTTEHTRTAKD